MAAAFGRLEAHLRRANHGPQGNGFESAGVFNPAVVKRGNQFIMLYRAQNKNGTSRVGYATSSDGVQFIRRANPVMEPATEYEQEGGLEDPRLIKMVYNGADDRTVYATGWVLFDKNDPTKVLARSEKPIFSVEQEWGENGTSPERGIRLGNGTRRPQVAFLLRRGGQVCGSRWRTDSLMIQGSARG